MKVINSLKSAKKRDKRNKVRLSFTKSEYGVGPPTGK